MRSLSNRTRKEKNIPHEVPREIQSRIWGGENWREALSEFVARFNSNGHTLRPQRVFSQKCANFLMCCIRRIRLMYSVGTVIKIKFYFLQLLEVPRRWNECFKLIYATK